MKIVIIGLGTIGKTILKILAKENHTITIIDENKYAVIPIDICGAITIKNVYRQKAKLIFIDRSRADVIRGILERNVSNEDKMQRIISLENEYKNEIFCDAVLRNDKTIEEAAEKLLELIKNWMKKS